MFNLRLINVGEHDDVNTSEIISKAKMTLSIINSNNDFDFLAIFTVYKQVF